jgi:LPXTG-site transpeptidase (sortase) family protein
MPFLSSIALILTLLASLIAPLAAPAPLAETEPEWRVEIPRVGINAPVETAERTTLDGRRTWTVPCDMSASLMRRGTNTTLFGHRDTCGGVFDNLAHVVMGDVVTFDERTYVVKERHVVVPDDIWPINDHGDDRLTMISCWPPGSIAQRLVIVAVHEAPSGPSTRPAPAKTAPLLAAGDFGLTNPAQASRPLIWKVAAMPIAIVSAGVLLPNRVSR